MRKTNIRKMSVMLAVMVLAGFVLVGAGAAGEYPGSGTQEDPWWCGADTGIGHATDSVTAWLDNNTGKLTIAGTGAMYDFGYCEAPWGTAVTSVSFPDGLTHVGRYTFYDCSGLTSVDLPDSVTSIGTWAFGCSGLTSVVIPDSVTSIGYAAFNGCSGLTSVTIGSGVTTIGENAFGDCTSLISVIIPDSVEIIGDSAFSFCTGLISAAIGSGVTSIGDNTFLWCEKLESITVNSDNQNYSSDSGILFDKDKTTLIQFPGGKSGEYTIPDGVETIGWNAFSYCSGLTSVVIPESVTSIGYAAFNGCSGLTSVTIGSGVTSIGENAFSGCTGLTSVTIPDNVISIGDYAFSPCSCLTSVTIGSGLTSLGKGTFLQCTKLESITVNPENQNYSSDSGILFDKDKTTLIQYPGGKSGEYTIPESVTSIGDYAFDACSGLTSVTIPDSVEIIGDSAFESCSGLTSVAIGNGVTSIGNSAFCYCSGLTSVAIPDSVISIGDYAFLFCSGLTSVVIPDSVEIIGNSAFCYCIGLTSVTIGSGVTSIGSEAFSITNALGAGISLPDVKNGRWIDTTTGKTATVINNDNHSHAFTVEVYAQSPSSVTSFSGKKDGNDFTFDRAVVITKATLPGATYATVTNTSGSGWYTCNLATDGTNGVAYFQVPLDVIAIKGWTVNDVSMSGCRTTYLTSENGYAKYSAVIDGAGSYTIGFEKDAAQKAAEKVQEVVEQKQTATEQKQAAAEKVQEVVEQKQTTQTAAKTPFPVLGILAGLGIAGVLVMRRK